MPEPELNLARLVQRIHDVQEATAKTPNELRVTPADYDAIRRICPPQDVEGPFLTYFMGIPLVIDESAPSLSETLAKWKDARESS